MFNVIFYNQSGNKIDFDVSSIQKGNGCLAGYALELPTESSFCSIVDGTELFAYSTFSSFNFELPNLKKGDWGFSYNKNLKSFSINLPNLTSTYQMFRNDTSLTSFIAKMPNLKDARNMFHECNLLTEFISETSKLENASSMFVYCSKLNNFQSDLSSLSSGARMFDGCILSPESIMIISDTIKKWESGTHPIALGLDCLNSEEDKNRFANDAGFDNWDDLHDSFISKGWTVTYQFNKIANAATLEEMVNVSPIIWAKIEPAMMDEAGYISEDGQSFYNIDWGHEVSDTNGYTQFGSLLEACGYWGIIPKEYYED